MRISDWSSDVCSSDLGSNIPSWPGLGVRVVAPIANSDGTVIPKKGTKPRAITRGADRITVLERGCDREIIHCIGSFCSLRKRVLARTDKTIITSAKTMAKIIEIIMAMRPSFLLRRRSEEHTSELQSLMRHSYAVFCLKK